MLSNTNRTAFNPPKEELHNGSKTFRNPPKHQGLEPCPKVAADIITAYTTHTSHHLATKAASYTSLASSWGNPKYGVSDLAAQIAKGTCIHFEAWSKIVTPHITTVIRPRRNFYRKQRQQEFRPHPKTRAHHIHQIARNPHRRSSMALPTYPRRTSRGRNKTST